MACQVAPQLFILSLFIRTERFPLFGHQADQAFDVIPALQQILDECFTDRQLLVAHLIEQILDDVGEADDGLQAKQAGGALDGVGCPEDGADELAIVRLVFQRQQCGLHLLEQLTCLGDVGLQGLIKIDAHE